MSRNERFTFLCNEQERRAIIELAALLQRSQSDAVRFVVLSAARELAAEDTQSKQEPEGEQVGH